MKNLPIRNLQGKPIGAVDFHDSFLRDVAAANSREGVSVKLWPIIHATTKQVLGFTVNFEEAR